MVPASRTFVTPGLVTPGFITRSLVTRSLVTPGFTLDVFSVRLIGSRVVGSRVRAECVFVAARACPARNRHGQAHRAGAGGVRTR